MGRLHYKTSAPLMPPASALQLLIAVSSASRPPFYTNLLGVNSSPLPLSLTLARSLDRPSFDNKHILRLQPMPPLPPPKSSSINVNVFISSSSSSSLLYSIDFDLIVP